MAAIATLVHSFAESVVAGIINGHLLLFARWEISGLRELFLRVQFLGAAFCVTSIISLVIAARHGDLDAPTAPGTHFALPIARHGLIQHSLLVRFLRLRAPTWRLLRVGLQGNVRDFFAAHSLLIKRVGS